MPRRYKTVLKDGVQRPEHRVIWEKVNGPIPEGCEIHHRNGDGRDNRLENLQMLTRSEHRLYRAIKSGKPECVVDELKSKLEALRKAQTDDQTQQ